MKIYCKAPQSLEEFEKYYHLRWKVLRKPWQQPLGSEQDSFEQQSCHRMIIDENNNTVAVGRIHQTSQYQAQIRYMAVNENNQGLGIGNKLIQSLEQHATMLGINEITLNAREQALEFYQKLGYIKLGFVHKLYDEINHYAMMKKLSPSNIHQTQLAEQLQTTWHNTIPLSKAMNVRLCYYDQHSLITSCDQVFNKNLHNTMFAGSIYTLATLTGWGWIYMQLELAGINSQTYIVLAEGKIRYLAPITGFAYAKTQIDYSTGNTDNLQKGEKARFSIKVEICNGDSIAAIFEGLYVAIPKRKPNV